MLRDITFPLSVHHFIINTKFHDTIINEKLKLFFEQHTKIWAFNILTQHKLKFVARDKNERSQGKISLFFINNKYIIDVQRRNGNPFLFYQVYNDLKQFIYSFTES